MPLRPTLFTSSPTAQRRLSEYNANGHTFYMVAIEKGTFLMQGDHEITFPEDFELGQYPVTQALWEAVMGENPSDFKGANRPVENVSWDNIMGTEDGVKKRNTKAGFLDRLNTLITPEDGYRFALPSEAQWEYAARGGRYGATFPHEFTGSNYLPEVGWYRENSQRQTQPVGRKLPNALGLYDMRGNVWEWCEDVWQDNYEGAPEDGSARVTGEEDKVVRVVRGGSWDPYGNNGRVVARSWNLAYDRDPARGFRLSRYRLTP